MNLLRFLLRNSKWTTVFAILFSIASGIAGASLIAAIHSILSSQDRSSPKIWGYCLLCLLLLVTQMVSQILLLRISQETIYDLRLQLSRSIIKAPLRGLEKAGSGRLMAALTGDAATISGALLGVPIMCINLATIVTCLIYISFLSWQLLLGLVAFMIVSSFIYQLAVKKAMRYLRLAREEADTLFSHFRAIIDGNKELKLNRQRHREFFLNDIQASALRVKGNNVVGQTTYTIASAYGRLLFFIFIGLILFALPLWFRTTPQDLTGYVLVILYINTPITVLVNTIPTFNQAKIALQKVEKLGLSLQQQLEADSLKSLSDTTEWQSLELKGVTHTYYHENEDSNFVLGPINLTFSPAEVVFIIGGNGSGKSTLAKVLTGLYIPETGEIRLNGQVITDETRESYRELFSAVFSDFYLFERVAARHSSNGSERDALAREFLIELQLDHKVGVKDGVFSTTALSQGQRKRLMLLNAYMENRPFYVFDEWASDQDPAFKQVFYKKILPDLKRRNKTVIVISHDDRFYNVADRIVKLEYGSQIQS